MFLDRTLLGQQPRSLKLKSIFLEDYDPPLTAKIAKKKCFQRYWFNGNPSSSFFRVLIQKKTCGPSLKGVNMEIDNNKQRSVRSKKTCFQSPRLLKWNIVHNWIEFQIRMLRLHGTRDQNGSKEMLKLKQYEN